MTSEIGKFKEFLGK